MENQWKDYFTFSKKERTGIIVLLVLIATVTVLPYCWSVQFDTIVQSDEQLVALVQQLNDTTQNVVINEKPFSSQANDHVAAATHPVVLFEFDPNTLPADDWRKLGLQERTIQTIQRYLAKGGKFRKPEDLGRIYGMTAMQAQQLMPYVRIVVDGSQQNTFAASSAPVRTAIAKPVIEINQADTTALIALPGIGSKLAQRIVNFRDRLGGFYAVEQLAETYGLPDSVFQRIRNRLQCTDTSLRKININTAVAEELKQHPYMRWNIANAIVRYRQQHGAFKTPDELQQVDIVTPDMLRKLLPYITVD